MSRTVVVGAGGNIGSHLIPHLARVSGVTEMHLVDGGVYEAGNVFTQNIDRRDVGRPKVDVQAARVERINASLVVTTSHEQVEDSPLGLLRGDVMLTCLDSRRARIAANQAARQLGMHLIDAGISRDDLLVRVQVFAPGPESACFECALSDADYLQIEQIYPCAADSAVVPTNAPSSLGALAAAYQAIECKKLLARETTDVLLGRELLASARHHTHFVTTMRRNPSCRMPDHEPWSITRSACPAVGDTVRDAVALGEALPGAEAYLTFGVSGQPFALSVWCAACGRTRAVLRLERTARLSPSRCWHCRKAMVPQGFDLHETVPVRSLPPAALGLRLSRVGLKPGDVITLSTRSALARYEVGGPA